MSTNRPRRREWVPIQDAIGLVARELYIGGSRPAAENDLVGALRDGIIRSRRRRVKGAASAAVELDAKDWVKLGSVWELPDAPNGSDDHYEVNHHDLREWLDPTHVPQAANRPGRPAKWDWEGFWIEATLLANRPDGLPDKQADFETLMTQWFEERCETAPAESQIRERAGKLYAARKAKK